jgi:hypothetical protein
MKVYLPVAACTFSSPKDLGGAEVGAGMAECGKKSTIRFYGHQLEFSMLHDIREIIIGFE